jgi:UDPglucose 6-dehydrogenase
MAIKKMKNIKICCIGAGYVGGPTMAVIANKCANVEITVVDSDKDKINRWNGDLDNLPVFEPGLKEIIELNRNKNLFFSNEINDAIRDSRIIFIAVNTPTLESGPGAGFGANLKYIRLCAEQIARVANEDKIIVEKSTVPIKTAEMLNEVFTEINPKYNFEVLSNPEFLAEGTAIEDLLNPDRVLIGGDNTISGKKSVKILSDIYSEWIPKEKILTTNVWSSELSKLASNAMLAQRISSINSLSALCDKTGADILEVSNAIGHDHRIGKYFLSPSVGFGGSCFQKDILNLVYLCKNFGLNEVAEYWHQVVKINDYQKKRLTNKIVDNLGKDLSNKNITLFGWSFKKDTNDSRESASIYIANDLLELGANLKIYDPKSSIDIIINDLLNISNISMNELSQRVTFYDDHVKSVVDSNCIVILTEWDEFKNYDWDTLQNNLNSEKTIFDGRYILKNIYSNKVITL